MNTKYTLGLLVTEGYVRETDGIILSFQSSGKSRIILQQLLTKY